MKARRFFMRIGETVPKDIMKIIESNPSRMKGMCLNGRTDTQDRTNVSDDIKEELTKLARKEFISNFGMSDGEEQSSITKKYLMSLPESQRLSASNTLNDIYSEEAKRLQDIAKERIPNWQPGQSFDSGIFADVISGNVFDEKV